MLAMQAPTRSLPMKGWFMNHALDPKTMAKHLRTELSSRKIEISHSESLEIVAKQFGFKNWNVLAAQTNPSELTSNGVCFERTCPILRIFDEEQAKEFYLGFLGFQLDWEHRFGDNFPLNCQVSRAGLQLHLSGHHGDSSPGASVWVGVKGIREFREELFAKNYKHAKPGVEEQPWGLEMKITDPFHSSIRFCKPRGGAQS